MTQLNAVTLSAFLMTTIVLFVLGFFAFIPPWAVFITWACFFHLDGGVNRNQAFMATSRHMAFGAMAAWVSAIVLLNNPFHSGVLQSFWGPVFIGIIIAMIARMGMMTLFSVTPAIIYGYASVFAFASTAGLFSSEHLLTLSFNNALCAIGFSILVGAVAGYLNATLVAVLLKKTGTDLSKNDSTVHE